jgi:two-component system response regulator DesR
VIRVLLVHEVSLLRSALTALLREEEDIDVTATGLAHAARRARTVRPQVCVMDLDGSTPGDGADIGAVLDDLAESCAAAGGRLLVLASPDRPGRLRRAFEARALGYVNRDGSEERLMRGIRRVADGHRYVDETLAYGFLQAAEMPLTRRELSVLTLAADGATVGEIARSLHLASGTVRNYFAAITRKTGARNRVDAIRISRGAGWV